MSSHKKVTEYEKSLKLFLHVSKIIFVILTAINIALPIVKTRAFIIIVCKIIIISVWGYACLSSLGYCKKVISEKDYAGRVRYETSVPFLPIAFLRIFEAFYLFVFRSGEVNWKNLAICIIADVVYLLLLLIDKSRYYYESAEVTD